MCLWPGWFQEHLRKGGHLQDIGVTGELVNHKHISLTIAVDIREPKISALKVLGELDLFVLLKDTLVVLDCAGEFAVGGYAEVVGAAVAYQIRESNGHCLLETWS